MPEYQTKRRVHHSPQDMFALVADVERYPEFLPLCEGLSVRSRRKGSDNKEVLVADMTVGYKSIRETFTTQVLLKPDERVIDVKYIDGPFRYLDNRWRFIPVGDKECMIDFYIDYAFKNRVLGVMMGSMFDRAFRTFAESFEKRADEIYSPASSG